jgi:hypothetical protein
MESLSIQQLSVSRGEFYEPSQSSKWFLSSGYELRPGFIAMVWNRPFSRVINVEPYNHLQEFKELCLCLVILGMTQETLRWKLFPFSHREGGAMVHPYDREYERWLGRTPNWVLLLILPYRTHRLSTDWHPQFWSIKEEVHRCSMGEILTPFGI